MKCSWILLVAALLATAMSAQRAGAQDAPLQPIPAAAASEAVPMPAATPEPAYPYWYGTTYQPAVAWHGYNYDAAWNMPIALVVPPTAKRQARMGWGVGNTRESRVYSQFHRDWPGPGTYDQRAFQPTPPWPSDTDQFGVYYVRGPR